MKVGVVVGLQITQLSKDQDFSKNWIIQKEEHERRLKYTETFLAMKKLKIIVKLCRS
jgi:hypothetical protein